MNYSDSQQREFLGHYESHKDKLYSYIVYKVGLNHQLAEDLLMEVILKAYENFSKFNSEKASFTTWIYTITNNHLKNYWAKKKPVSIEKLQEKGEEPSIDNASEEAEKNIAIDQVHEILDLMEEGEKEIIVLKYVNDLSDTEISKITGKNEGAIRTQLSRAKKRFKDYYTNIHTDA